MYIYINIYIYLYIYIHIYIYIKSILLQSSHENKFVYTMSICNTHSYYIQKCRR